MNNIKTICYFAIFLFLFHCKSNTRNEKLIIDAGSFLDVKQAKEIERRLSVIEKRGVYHLFLYTVIAEEYYRRKDYDEYIFSIISKNDTISNKNVLLYLSYNDKKIRIITGNKAKEELTDSLSKTAINRLIPYLSQRQYYGGVNATITFIDSVFMKRVNIQGAK